VKRSARLAIWATAWYLSATLFIPRMLENDGFAIAAFIILVLAGSWFHAWSDAQRRREERARG